MFKIQLFKISLNNLKVVAMKKILILLAALAMPLSLAMAQADEGKNYRIPLIGERAPSFTAETTNGTLNFPDDYAGKWKVLFAHPQDFTPVCSSEILELAYLQKDFDKLNTRIAVVSTDPMEMHVQWKKALEEVQYKGRPQEKIKFPIIDDSNDAISKLYGMIHPSISGTKAVRGVFIIDPDNIVRAVSFYPLNVGRNIDEILRSLKALQTADDTTMTPADWNAGEDLLVAVPPVTDQNTANVPDGYYKYAWFMWYQKASQKK